MKLHHRFEDLSVFAFDSIIGNIGVLICDIISFVAFEIYTFGDLG